MMEHSLLRQLLPGESCYSLVARAHLASPYGNWGYTNQVLFGRVEVRLHAMLPGHLDALAAWANIDVNQLRLQGSAHPLFAFGLGAQDMRLQLMRSESAYNASAVTTVGRLAASKLSFGHYLKSCPECMKQDEQSYGVAYWHTVHQVQGVTVCPIHQCRLQQVRAGDGGVNHQYLLPLWQESDSVKGTEAEIRLTVYLAKLYQFLGQQTPIVPMPELYLRWLEVKGMVTKAGRIRWRYLKPELISFWSELFQWPVNTLPLELSAFGYVPQLIHHCKPTHYIRHVLVMAYLAKSPELFFEGPLRAPKSTVDQPSGNNLINVARVLTLFDEGRSMRQITGTLHCSMGFVKALLLRHGREVERRSQFISPEVERGVWRKAFIGMHRADIANFYKISVGAVEQMVQHHQRLSEWRHYLMMQKRRRVNRQALSEYIAKNPYALRNAIKQACSAYMWLYKHDREWLYQHLPSARVAGSKGIDWSIRDLVVLAQLYSLGGRYSSLSAIDWRLGGHGWLVRQRQKFPRSMAFIESKRQGNKYIFWS
ncbi:TnsD family Tn7-like transposition protein [Agarivorans aestuarii]|uniref:TnsD family Tn7-like transposition protein n=1 Tax=Agarivorans aestuarii TaxID=1563703 RepID=A0ABU7G2V9_9ALTE|nr:TnsD family Tn7-like transposition protein [Agarivorans aestuarii]MEE1673717.1 TnsD family Tn7-like transposition protein [Agarivorans aestuarii]